MSEEPQANLGLATTEELFREIIARFMRNQYTNEVSVSVVVAGAEKALVLAEMLGSLAAVEKEYRTVDG